MTAVSLFFFFYYNFFYGGAMDNHLNSDISFPSIVFSEYFVYVSMCFKRTDSYVSESIELLKYSYEHKN